MDSNLEAQLHDWSLENNVIDPDNSNSDDAYHGSSLSNEDVARDEDVAHQGTPLQDEDRHGNISFDEGETHDGDFEKNYLLKMPNSSDEVLNCLDGSSPGLLGDIIDDDDISNPESIDVNPFDGLPYSSSYYELLKRRKELPVWKAKDDFVLAVDESQVILVTGRAGSGKSTQIPHWCVQFARESNFEFGTVVCTQPSQHAAVSLAIQVAKEMDLTEVGVEVGYKIPQMDCTSENTMLTFCTDDILLREMADDPLLRNYSFVIIDEVQERSIATDILLALFKSIQNIREELKIIIVSHPQQMPSLEDFFEEVPIVDLEFLEEFVGDDKQEHIEKEIGSEEEKEKRRRKQAELRRLKKIEIFYQPIEEPCLVEDVVNLIVDLHSQQNVEGNFLVFLPTVQDIEESCDRIARQVAIKSLRGEAGEIVVLPLYRNQIVGTCQAIYDHNNNDSAQTCLRKRQVIVCDHSAESSFSMDNVKVVIDSGREDDEIFNCRTRTHSKRKKFITQNIAIMRTERCGVGGKVYRLYSEEQFKSFDTFSTSPIKRVELTSHILLLKRLLQRLNMRFSDCVFIEPPDPEAYMVALEELDYHGALDENGNLSDLGAVMSEFPLSVPLAKCIIASCGEDCVQEILTIVAMVTTSTCWATPRGFEEEAMVVRKQLSHRAGDHFTLLNIYHRFIRHKKSEAWCLKHFISYQALKTAEKKREELLGIMERLELPISDTIIDPALLENSVKRALLAGYFMQVARDTDGCGNYHIIRDKHIARINPESIMRDKYSTWILYHSFRPTENSYVTTVSDVNPNWIAEIAPQSYVINLPANESTALLIKLSTRLRKKQSDVDDDVPTSSDRTLNDMNDDDIDVITQATRSMTYAYHQAAEYMSSTEERSQQCRVQ